MIEPLTRMEKDPSDFDNEFEQSHITPKGYNRLVDKINEIIKLLNK